MRLNKLIILSTILLVFGGNLHGAADTAYDLNIDVNSFQLENGFQVLVVERPATPQVACRLAIRAGSALEQAGKTGIFVFVGRKNGEKATTQTTFLSAGQIKMPGVAALKKRA